MRAFVTGGSGFVGRNLIAMLRARGDEVRALARSDAAAGAVSSVGATVVRGDLDDEAALAAGMAGCDVVFHSAAKVEVWGKRRDFQRINVDGTRRVVDAARAAGVARVVHVSTEAVLVGKGAPKIRNADETWPLPRRPLGHYPWSKGRAEDVVRAANRDGLTTVIVRPRFLWGKGDTTLLPKFVEAVQQQRFAWIGGGTHLTSTCHVRNLCAALLLAAERGRGGETYFVTDGEPVQMKEFVTAMLATVDVDPGTRAVPVWAASVAAWLGEAAWTLSWLGGEPPVVRTAVRLMGEEVTVNDAKARRELGYAPVVTIAAGLAELR